MVTEIAPHPIHSSPERVREESPQVIANPALPNVSLLYSIPVYNEWSNGNFLRNIDAFLHQHVDSKEPIEVNYIVNMGNAQDGVTASPKKRKIARSEADQTVSFLCKIVQAQGAITQSELDELLLDEDPLHQAVIKTAARKKGSIAVSAVDITRKNLKDVGYHGGPISRARTAGFDYAYSRLEDSQAIFALYDCDTIPSTNLFSQQLISQYKDPQKKYHFNSMSYLPPGNSKALVMDSPRFSTGKTNMYNRYDLFGSPQITFRIESYSELKGIVGGKNSAYEDYTTAYRLMQMYRAYDSSESQPISLTSDRDGAIDGKGRLKSLGNFFDDRDLNRDISSLLKDERQLIGEIEMIQDSSIRGAIASDYESVKKYFDRHQALQLRFQRKVAGLFFDAVKKRDISIKSDEIKFSTRKIADMPQGRALLHFITSNRELISSLDSNDLHIIGYLLGKENYPKSAVLSPFQKVLREYLGEYKSIDDLSCEIPSTQFVNRDIRYNRSDSNRVALLQPILARTLAVGYTMRRHFRDKIKDRNIGQPIMQPISNDEIYQRSYWTR